jgi:membrane-bound lytic murein transglycosylase F
VATILPASSKFVQNVAMPTFQFLYRLMYVSFSVLALAAALTLFGCDEKPAAPPAASIVAFSGVPSWQHGELVALEDGQSNDTDTQFNHELAKLFAAHLHAKLNVVVVEPSKVAESLARQRGDFAAMSLRSNEVTTSLLYAPSFLTREEYLVVHRDLPIAKSAQVLDRLNIMVIDGSAQQQVLQHLKNKQPTLAWQVRPAGTVAALLDEVARGEVTATLANQEQIALAKNFTENLREITIPSLPPSQLAWAFSADSDRQLRNQAGQFFAAIKRDGRLQALIDRYYGFNDRLSSIDASTFLIAIDKTLPRYENVFIEAAQNNGLDWRLLAALSYQESHWNPLATSFTNVRGMMMLTEATADLMQVENRLDVRQSVRAGARYLAQIRDRLPAHIAEPDRTWMALASYNQGYGHLEDARVLTQRMAMNADHWVDVKKWMPQLNQPTVFNKLKHGYARGGEAVILVENIRMYYEMLQQRRPSPATENFDASPYQLLDRHHPPRIKNFSKP